MTTWILIVMWAVSSTQLPNSSKMDTSTAITMQEFNSKTTCDNARQLLSQQYVRSICVQK